MTESIPAWKFWHPLPLWQVFAIGFVAQLACIIPIVALREGLGLGIPEWVGGGVPLILIMRHVFPAIAA
jgi:hypothetical protein